MESNAKYKDKNYLQNKAVDKIMNWKREEEREPFCVGQLWVAYTTLSLLFLIIESFG